MIGKLRQNISAAVSTSSHLLRAVLRLCRQNHVLARDFCARVEGCLKLQEQLHGNARRPSWESRGNCNPDFLRRHRQKMYVHRVSFGILFLNFTNISVVLNCAKCASFKKFAQACLP